MAHGTLSSTFGCAAVLRGALMSVWLSLLTIGSQTAAQGLVEPKLRIEAGMHTSVIWQIATDAEGRWAATASGDKTVRVWDVASGLQTRVLRPPISGGAAGKLSAVAMSRDGEVVAVAGWSNLGDHKGNSVFLFHRSTGQLIRVVKGLPEGVNRLEFSPDGRWLAAALAGRSGIRIWRWADGTVPLEDAGYGDQTYGLHFAPPAPGSNANSGAQWLATSSLDGKLRTYSIAADFASSGSLKPSSVQVAPGGRRPLGVAYAPGGRLLAVGYVDSARVDVLDGQSLSLRYSPSVVGIDDGNLASVAFSADGLVLAAAGTWQVDDMHQVRRWSDAGRGKPEDTPATSNTVTALTPLSQRAGGGWLASSGDPAWGLLKPDGRWEQRGKVPIADLRGILDDGAFSLSDSGRVVQFGFVGYGRAVHQFNLRQRHLRAGPLTDGQAPRTEGLLIEGWDNTTRPTLNGRPLPLEANEMSRSLALLPGSTSFALGSDNGLHLFKADGSVGWTQPAVGGPVWGVNVPLTGELAGKVVVAAYGDGTIRWHRVSDGEELLAFFPHADRQRWVLWTPSGYFDASAGGEDLIGWHVNRLTIDGVKVTDVEADMPAKRAGITVGDVVLAINDKAVDDESLGQMVRDPNTTWPLRVLIRRDGRRLELDVSPMTKPGESFPRIGIGTQDSITEVQASDFYPASRFRARFYRPDVVDRVLATLDEAEAVKLADLASNRRSEVYGGVAQQLPPVVELISRGDMSIGTSEVTVRVRARTAPNAPVITWRVRVNGQIVPVSRGLGRPETSSVAQPNERDLLVPLPPQDSEIQVFAENRHGPSTPATVRVKWTGSALSAAAQPAAFNIKPKLYALAVGVSDYQNPGVNKLRLAAKDASDFVAALQRQKGRLYRDVEVRLLQDLRAGKDDILEGMDWLQKSATQHDVAMMFVAGHGLNDGARGYTFLPVNGDPGRLFSTGVRLSDIRAVLGSMVAKTIFFFDSCHSGGVVQDRGERARTLDQDVNVVINELSGAENGVTVFSSSSSRQVSFEDLAWGNGAFTKAVVEGLGGEAAYQPGDNRITLKMLDLYISERVKKLTNGRQTPVSRSPVEDFPVALK